MAHTAAGSIEQAYPQFVFQLPELTAQCGLRHIESRLCEREPSRLGNMIEIEQAP